MRRAVEHFWRFMEADEVVWPARILAGWMILWTWIAILMGQL